MTRQEFLQELREIVCASGYTATDPDDWSGVSTRYLVDQDLMLAELDERLAEFATNNEE